MKLDFKVFGLGALLGVLAAVAPGCGGGQTGCNSTNCANGCCSAAGACLTGASNSACGSGGATCVACTTGNVCSAGACVPESTGGGTGGGAMGGGTGGGAMGGGTGGGGDMDAGTGGGTGGGGDMDAGTGGGGGDMDAGTGGGTGGGGGDMDAGMDAGVDVSAQIAAVRAAADMADGGMVGLPITGALVTYLKPLVPSAGSSDPAGFFLQGDPMGPALFVAVDPSTLAGGLAVGDLVELTVDTVGKSGGLRQATAVSNVTISSRSNPVSGFSQSVSNVDFTNSANLDTYESRLISMTGTVTAEPAAAGGGYKSASVDTMGTVDGGTTIKLRLPIAVMDAEALGPACTFSMSGTPMWRFNAQAQPSAFTSGELSSVSCPGPSLVSASASSPTQVTANFSRDLAAATVDAGVFSITGGSGLTVADAVLASPRSVTLTTSNQTDMQAYSLTATSALTDTRGTAFTGNSVNFTGTGSAQCMPGVVISAVFGGNGATNPFIQDFVELHNRTSSAIDVTGWSVQYASSTGTSWQVASLSGSIAAGGYYLVGLNVATGTGTAIPTPDATGSINLSGTNGKVALVNNATALSGACPTGVVDFFGYGTANCFEGTVSPALSSANAAVRNDASGATAACVDTNNNAGDFTIGAATAPRNSASTPNTCTCP